MLAFGGLTGAAVEYKIESVFGADQADSRANSLASAGWTLCHLATTADGKGLSFHLTFWRKSTKSPSPSGRAVQPAAAAAAAALSLATTVHVGNLPFDTDDAALSKGFEGLDVRSAKVAVRPNGRSKGHGLVELGSVADVEKALLRNGCSLGGRAVTIRLATAQQVRSN